ncbi:hypothetical protein FQN57_001391 [Myotisia sp. PD_48]|nr:hypothetical protein FQN57_001391 [Myotisia sp. PD_48]
MHSTRHGAGPSTYLALTRFLTFALSNLPALHAAPILHVREHDLPKSPDDPSLWLYLTVAAVLVITGGIFAGLTIALMGQDEIYLQVIKTSGEGAEKKHAERVLRLLQRGKHWVLVTLLLSNVITNETLPIVLDRSLGGGWPAILGSTVLIGMLLPQNHASHPSLKLTDPIVIFGEVVPQSICVRYGLPIGAWMSPGVLGLMYLTSPVSWPIAKLLDRLLGEDHGTFYKKAGLKTLVTLHKNLGAAGEQLNSDEVTIISAVLDLKEKPVGSIRIPMEDVFTMSADAVLDEKTMDLILSQGYSRIPIHAPDNDQNFVGMLLVKMLITYDPEDCKLVRDFALATLPETRPETSCLDIVNFFQEGKAHMVLVSEYPGEDHGALGVVTLEDVIEELIGEEIIDESDVFIDVHKAIRRMTPAPKYRFPKSRIVEIPPSAHNLAEQSAKPNDENHSPADAKTRQSSLQLGSPPQPTFYLRKSRTSEGEGVLEPIIKRGATAEIREQLKHLGPSNLASRPRQTRYNAVKIKPGTSPTQASSSTRDGDALPVSRRASEAASLLAKGTQERAADLKPSYGSVADRSTNSTPGLTSAFQPAEFADAQRSILNRTNDIYQDRFPSGSKSSSAVGNGAVSSDASDSSTDTYPHYIQHRPTKSGSITEHFVDSHGIRKVILQTSSHAPSDDDDRPSMSQSRLNSHSGEDKQGSKTRLQGSTAEGSSSKSAGKKKRRRKRKGPLGSRTLDEESAESQPLLD